jgi:predicted dehydrogenase
MAASLRLAVAGAGVIGRAHVERIQASAECELVALVDPSPAPATRAQAGAAVPVYADLAAMLAAQRPDGVILATPNALHVPGALACIAAGVACLVEKPVSDTVVDAQRLVDAVQTSGVPVLVGHHRRHSAVLADAVAVIRSGRIGRVVAVQASATFHKPDRYFSEAPWRAQPGGGPILINLVHEIDNLRALVGDIAEVQAFASNAVRGHAVEDTVVINLRFREGALGTFLLSDTAASPRSWEQTSGENTAYDPHPEQDCYVIAGTQGTVMVPTQRVYRFEGERSWFAPLTVTTLPRPEVDPLVRQLAHFCAVIRREAVPLVSAESALQTLRTTLAVVEAARSGRAVRCD